MKTQSLEQFAIVKEDSASLFTARLNEELLKLKGNNPHVRFSEADPLCAYIDYTINETTPETVSEASEIAGVSFVCAQCPHFRAPLRDDGEVDKRCKYGDCEHTELGRTFKTSRACDILYELIASGNCRIVTDEEV